MLRFRAASSARRPATLTIMAAAPAETFEAAQPVLAAMGDKVFHVGERPGQGAMVKTVNQLLCGVHIAVAAEAFSLAAKVGVDMTVMLEIVSGSAASSWMLKDRGPRMLQEEPEVTSAVDIFVKDLGIVLEAGRDSQGGPAAGRARPSDVPRDLGQRRWQRRRQPGHPGL